MKNVKKKHVVAISKFWNKFKLPSSVPRRQMYQTLGKILQSVDRMIMKNVKTNFIKRLHIVTSAARLILYFILFHSAYTVCCIPRRLSVIWTVNYDFNPSYVNQFLQRKYVDKSKAW